MTPNSNPDPRSIAQREREAFVAGGQWVLDQAPARGSEPTLPREAICRYPDPKQKNELREVGDILGVTWSAIGGALHYKQYLLAAQVACWLPISQYKAMAINEARIRLWADLMERPYISRTTGKPTDQESE